MEKQILKRKRSIRWDGARRDFDSCEQHANDRENKKDDVDVYPRIRPWRWEALHKVNDLPAIFAFSKKRREVESTNRVGKLIVRGDRIFTEQLAAITDDPFTRVAGGHIVNAEDSGYVRAENFNFGEGHKSPEVTVTFDVTVTLLKM